MKTYQQDYTAYQTYALLDFNISFEKDIPADDISRTVIEVTERIDINKFVDFTPVSYTHLTLPTTPYV